MKGPTKTPVNVHQDHPIRLGVVLFNLGAPSKPSGVFLFLFRLFMDPAIIRTSVIGRFLLALLISLLRYRPASANYKLLGGGSPLLANTRDQARALTSALAKKLSDGGVKFQLKTVIAMRYHPPRARAAIRALKEFGADKVVLVPLYPQFSTTTTASSLTEWHRQAKKAGFHPATHILCCWPLMNGWVRASAEAIRDAISENFPKYRKPKYRKPKGQTEGRRFHVLFSAHGIPTDRVRELGDPYQYQIELSATAIAKAANLRQNEWSICYQSRVGRKEWLRPYIQDKLKENAQNNTDIVIYPVAFVSEHLETLVELDIEYQEMTAKINPAVKYIRVPTVGSAEYFIESLADRVISSIEGNPATYTRNCPNRFTGCFRAVKSAPIATTDTDTGSGQKSAQKTRG